MKRVDYPIWNDEFSKFEKAINKVTNQTKYITIDFEKGELNRKNYKIWKENVKKTLEYWTGKTYVGKEKDKRTQKLFQNFFEAILDLILLCKESDVEELKNFAEESLYRGKLYRYLGHYKSNEKDIKVKPKFNNIYVSWSKKSKNEYIESKLKGIITLVSCQVDAPYYGIDLDAFDVVKGDEQEVVFPTLKDTIISVDYK